jgi:two-component system, OmpR family, sensor histidine kinase SenX3
MFKRTLASIALVTGLAGVVAGIFGLEGVFVRERQDALDALTSQQSALQSYAVRDLQERCEGEMQAERSRLEAALQDPLVDGSGIVYVQAGRQRLPRRFSFLDRPAGEAKRLYSQLLSGEVSAGNPDEDDPWSERLRYLAAFRNALESGDRGGVERSFRAVLTHRARFVIDSRKDLFYQVALLDLLETRSDAAPGLMESMLRAGLTDSHGTRLPGLQSQLLARREKLSREDFELLAEHISRLSEGSGVRHDDFRERVAEPNGPAIGLSEPPPLPVLLEQGAWFIQGSDGLDIEGVAIDLEQLLSRTRIEMLDRGLLEEDDELTMAALPAEPQRVSSLPITVESARWARNRAAVQRRFWLKTGLAVTLLALVVGAASLWMAWTRRERQLLALKSDFVATVSHELRTPLASMRLMAETLERRLDGVDAARDYPGRIMREIDSLNFLVENILSFHRLEKGRWEPRVEDVRLSELVRTLERELPGTTRSRVSVQFDKTKDLVVRADPDLMKLLFLNLGTNACKYSDGDPVMIRIEAEPRHPLLIRVADNGIGIPGDQIENVFSEFYRAERSGRGFWLGPAICRRSTEIPAGHIRVADSSPDGTVFEMSFP